MLYHWLFFEFKGIINLHKYNKAGVKIILNITFFYFYRILPWLLGICHHLKTQPLLTSRITITWSLHYPNILHPFPLVIPSIQYCLSSRTKWIKQNIGYWYYCVIGDFLTGTRNAGFFFKSSTFFSVFFSLNDPNPLEEERDFS